jgi:hypothetical protein
MLLQAPHLVQLPTAAPVKLLPARFGRALLGLCLGRPQEMTDGSGILVPAVPRFNATPPPLVAQHALAISALFLCSHIFFHEIDTGLVFCLISESQGLW